MNLNNVLEALYKNNSHIPFRNSKLTLYLKENLLNDNLIAVFFTLT